MDESSIYNPKTAAKPRAIAPKPTALLAAALPVGLGEVEALAEVPLAAGVEAAGAEEPAAEEPLALAAAGVETEGTLERVTPPDWQSLATAEVSSVEVLVSHVIGMQMSSGKRHTGKVVLATLLYRALLDLGLDGVATSSALALDVGGTAARLGQSGDEARKLRGGLAWMVLNGGGVERDVQRKRECQTGQAGTGRWSWRGWRQRPGR